MEVTLLVNQESHVVDIEPEMPLLWVIRDVLGLTGTKYGCGIGLCGSCTVHVDGEAVRSCTTTAADTAGKAITTIEGLASTSPHPLQTAWMEENVSQCGYCQPGQIMTAAALLSSNPNPSPEEIEAAMSSNLCRCGTYQRIRKAIARAASGESARSGALAAGESLGELPLDPSTISYLPSLLPLAGAIAFIKDSQGRKTSRRGFLQVAAAAGAGLIIGISLPGCSEDIDESGKVTPSSAGGSSPAAAEEASPTRTTAAAAAVAGTDVAGAATSLPSGDNSPTSAAAAAATSTSTAGPTPTNMPSPTPTQEPTAFFEPNLYLTIDNNGIATIVVHRVEMGQGARTALPMIVAEELDIAWNSVRIQQAPADSRYGEQQTSGSSAIYETFGPLRIAGGQAKEMLIMAAAQIWGVDRESCYAENGQVIHEPSGRSAPYGDLVEVAATMPPVRRPLKDPAEFKIIGSRIGHVDNPAIVNGSMLFGTDINVPEMLYAAVVRGSELRGTIADYDASAAESVPGVIQILPIESGIVVVADSTWAAHRGADLLNITLGSGRFSDLNSAELAQEYRTALTPGTTETNFLESIYEISFLAHAALSPMNCTADVRSSSGEIWAPTQAPQYAKSAAQRITGLSADALTVHIPRLGGGFGRRLQIDYVQDAAEISKEIGRPVKVIWRREDDIRHDYYHPLSVHYASADLTNPRLPNIQSRTYGQWDQITGAWRAVSNFTDAFVRECFIDEMAEQLDRDPLELRFDLLPGSFQNPLEVAAEMSGWGDALPAGRSRGIAAFATWGVTPVVMVAEVSNEGGEPRVHRVVVSLDPGLAINPDMIEAQMEGGIAWGLSALLGKGITIVNGQVQQSNFHDYPVLRFDKMPEVETHIIPSNQTPRGVGEMGVPPIAPAVCNALYGLTGQRIRTLPRS